MGRKPRVQNESGAAASDPAASSEASEAPSPSPPPPTRKVEEAGSASERFVSRIPSSSEYAVMREIANHLYRAKMLPKGILNAEGALVLMLAGRELGFGPVESQRLLRYAEGQVALTAQGMNVRMNQLRLGRVRTVESTDTHVILAFERDGIETIVEWTIDRAARAGLAGRNTWEKYPRQMLYARALTEGLRQVFPETLAGMYSPDELGEDEWEGGGGELQGVNQNAALQPAQAGGASGLLPPADPAALPSAVPAPPPPPPPSPPPPIPVPPVTPEAPDPIVDNDIYLSLIGRFVEAWGPTQEEWVSWLTSGYQIKSVAEADKTMLRRITQELTTTMVSPFGAPPKGITIEELTAIGMRWGKEGQAQDRRLASRASTTK